ncbi:MAG: 50S ribosomal protein L32, partial [bacterium]
KRRTHWKIEGPTVVECPQCHQPKLPHHVCKECGYYNGKAVLAQA